MQTGVDAKIGFAIASILAQEMSAAGGLNVLAVPTGVKRTDFLETARTQKADFYISGYVTPVGDTAAVVEQVVSVDSGVILFSQTAQVQSVADVASQSLLARAQISRSSVGERRTSRRSRPTRPRQAPPTAPKCRFTASGASSIRFSTTKARRAPRLRHW